MAEARWDGPEAKPFCVRCTLATCPGFTCQSYAEADVAMERWNRRVQLPPPNPDKIVDLVGFTKKSLLRGEIVTLRLDRTGIFQSEEIAFEPHRKPLIPKPRE